MTSSFVSSQTSGLQGYNFINIAVCISMYSPVHVCIWITFALSQEGIKCIKCEGVQGLVAGGLGGKECSPSLGGELLGSHGVIAQLGLPALAPQAQGFYGLVCTSRGYG